MFQKILLAVDLNHESSWRKALPAAESCCRAFDAPLVVAMVAPDFHMPMVASYFPEDWEDQTHKEIDRQLKAFVEREVARDIETSHVTLRGGRIYSQLIEFADASGVDLVVMAAYRADLKDFLLGPNADRIVRHARQSVLVVRE